jgi:hypothetical protein
MNEGAGVHRPRYRRKSHAKCDVDAGIVANWRLVVGKVVPYLTCRDRPPHAAVSADQPNDGVVPQISDHIFGFVAFVKSTYIVRRFAVMSTS